MCYQAYETGSSIFAQGPLGQKVNTEYQADMPGKATLACFKLFITGLGSYECTRMPLWVHTQAVRGSPERAVMGLESQGNLANCNYV